MTTTLTSDPVASLLQRLFQEADAPSTPEQLAAFRAADRSDHRAFYGAAKDLYLAVSPETATLLYMLVRATGAQNVVEFGTSFGISTIHLAAALRDNDTSRGRLITTEFEPHKAATARENFATADLDDIIELREGDARETLKKDLPEQIDLVLLDGAKPLYPEVLVILEPKLRPGALIVADNADASPEYLSRVRGPGYASVPFASDVELSMYVASVPAAPERSDF